MKCRFPGSSRVPGSPRVVPVSNGESISTAFPAVAQESGAIHFKFFSVHMLSTDFGQLSACVTTVIHRLMHNSSTGYPA
jgi:hypothetical protein